MRIWFMANFGAVTFNDVKEFKWAEGQEPFCAHSGSVARGPQEGS